MLTLMASDRAAIEAMTDAQLQEVIRFARQHETTSACLKTRLQREALEAEAELMRRHAPAA